MGLIGGAHDKVPGDEEGRNEKHERLSLDAMRVDLAALKRTMTDAERRRIEQAQPGAPRPAADPAAPPSGPADRRRRTRPSD